MKPQFTQSNQQFVKPVFKNMDNSREIGSKRIDSRIAGACRDAGRSRGPGLRNGPRDRW